MEQHPQPYHTLGSSRPPPAFTDTDALLTSSPKWCRQKPLPGFLWPSLGRPQSCTGPEALVA